MSDSAVKALFLSYASQDAEAVERIAVALRAAGVEVWFDKSELTGGDAWDTKIRGQIGSCALFVPIISANTQARDEGYFRLEWKLAVDRSHLMAHDKPFLLPVVIDTTKDSEARVPLEFRAVQWTRLPGGEAPDKFCARVKNLLAGEIIAKVAEPGPASLKPATENRPSSRPWLLPMILGVTVIVAVAIWRPWKNSAAIPTAVAKPTPVASNATAAPVTEARKLVIQAVALFEPWDLASREDFQLAEQLLQRAVVLDPADGQACIALSLLDCGFVALSYDNSPARKQQARNLADRATKLAPDDHRAQFAQAFSYRFEPSLQEEAIRRLTALADKYPSDRLLVRTAGASLRVAGRHEEALRYLDRAAALPGGDASAHYNRAMSLRELDRLGEAETAVDQAIALAPALAKAYALKVSIALDQRSDMAEARALITKVPAQYLVEDFGAATASQIWLWSKDWDRCIAALVPARDYLETNIFTGPKAYRSGLAHQMAGRHDAAVADWHNALQVVERRLREQPSAEVLLWWKGVLLAALGDRTAAESILNLVEQQRMAGTSPVGAEGVAQLQVMLGKNDDALATLGSLKQGGVSLRYAYFGRLFFRFDPIMNPLRGDPRFQAWLETMDLTAGRKPAI